MASQPAARNLKSWSVSQISALIGGDPNGHGDRAITGIAGIREADEGDITFVDQQRYLPLIKETKASAVIVERTLDVDDAATGACIIRVENAGEAFARVVQILCGGERAAFEPGVHPSAVIGKDVVLGEGVCIQACVVIEDGASIGGNTVIYPNVYVGHATRIGRDCLIYPCVSIRERITIGNNVIIHSGAVIGSDGFGFSTVNRIHQKIPQLGTVEIEDDVEIGANVTIDRARFDRTHIGKGTKIDNLVQIAHNVWVGERCMIVGQSGIAGSSRVGNNVVLAAQAGIAGHLQIGDNTIISGRAGVTKSIPANSVVSGFPAQNHDKQIREQIYLRKLPGRVKELEERLLRLEEAAENHREGS